MGETYYNTQAQMFFNDTVNADLSALHGEFVALLPKRGTILDAGCGSGRDSLAFHAQGFAVTAFDASHQLAVLASAHTGLPVATCRFLEFQSDKPFDGIWACASLLHLPYAELARNLDHLGLYLAPQGYLYCSFKYGEGETERDGRHFTNLNECTLKQLVKRTDLALFKQWTTEDKRPSRRHELWLNAILCRK